MRVSSIFIMVHNIINFWSPSLYWEGLTWDPSVGTLHSRTIHFISDAGGEQTLISRLLAAIRWLVFPSNALAANDLCNCSLQSFISTLSSLPKTTKTSLAMPKRRGGCLE
ncbi:hypothetical protein YC2023_078954 [Brassica napus]